MSSLFGGAPKPPPVVVPPPPSPVQKMPDLASPNARESALAEATATSGMSREGTDLTGKKRQTLGGGGGGNQSAAPVATSDTYNSRKLG